MCASTLRAVSRSPRVARDRPEVGPRASPLDVPGVQHRRPEPHGTRLEIIKKKTSARFVAIAVIAIGFQRRGANGLSRGTESCRAVKGAPRSQRRAAVGVFVDSRQKRRRKRGTVFSRSNGNRIDTKPRPGVASRLIEYRRPILCVPGEWEKSR